MSDPYATTKHLVALSAGLASAAYVTAITGSVSYSALTCLGTVVASRLLIGLGHHLGDRLTERRELARRASQVPQDLADLRRQEAQAQAHRAPVEGGHTTITLLGPAGERTIRDNPTTFIGTCVIGHRADAREARVWLWNGHTERYVENTNGLTTLDDNSRALWLTRCGFVGRLHFLTLPGAEQVVKSMSEATSPTGLLDIAEARGWEAEELARVVQLLEAPPLILPEEDADETTDLDTHLARLHAEALAHPYTPSTTRSPIGTTRRALDLDG